MAYFYSYKSRRQQILWHPGKWEEKNCQVGQYKTLYVKLYIHIRALCLIFLCSNLIKTFFNVHVLSQFSLLPQNYNFLSLSQHFVRLPQEGDIDPYYLECCRTAVENWHRFNLIVLYIRQTVLCNPAKLFF